MSHKYTSYATFLCYTKNSRCSPMTYQNTTDPVTGAVTGGGFAPNPNSIYDDEIRPRYQLQTTYLKNGLNNACESCRSREGRRSRRPLHSHYILLRPTLLLLLQPRSVTCSASSSSVSWVTSSVAAPTSSLRRC